MKIPFIHYNLLQRLRDHKKLETKNRASTVIEPFIGKNIDIYTGLKYHTVTIIPEMVGYKLGSLAFTKKSGKSIHNSRGNRKRIEKMRRKITQRKVRKNTAKKGKGKLKTKAKKKRKGK